jgi:hypothetical protein
MMARKPSPRPNYLTGRRLSNRIEKPRQRGQPGLLGRLCVGRIMHNGRCMAEPGGLYAFYYCTPEAAPRGRNTR